MLASLANVLHKQNLPDRARVTAEEALAIAREEKEPATQARALNTLAMLAPQGSDVLETLAQARAASALTPRETEVLELIAAGASNAAIAAELFISAKTVSVHVSSILAKFGAASRREAAAIAHRLGLLAATD